MQSQPRFWKHKKSGHIYELLAIARDCTNARDGNRQALYTREEVASEGPFTRDWDEWARNFEPMPEK